VSVELLREYVEGMLSELSVDRKFVDHLRRASGLGGEEFTQLTNQARSIAMEWLSDAEYALGQRLHPNRRAQVVRFVAQRMPALIQRFRGNMAAAEQTMYNLLNSRFYSLRGER
jgi:hypothetical protein